MNDQISAAAEFWNRATVTKQPARSRWWMSPTIIRHINNIVCGERIEGLSAGFHLELARRLPQGKASNAVSVACGTGEKEISLVVAGLVDTFHLYEISTARVEIGREKAKTLGVSDRVTFYAQNAFDTCRVGEFDLVYWNNALHHMFDAPAAVRWSAACLKSGGLFAMDDFVGPSRFQWTDQMLKYGTLVRGMFSDSQMIDPNDPDRKIPREVVRPELVHMLETDPSEAADSGNILSGIEAVFPYADVILTGGVIYHSALNDVIANLDEVNDQALLFSALAIDRALAAEGVTQYAVVFAYKD